MLNLLKLNKICEDKDSLLENLCKWGLIPRTGSYPCKKCEGQLTLGADSSRIDGWHWYCTNKLKKKGVKCGATREFRKGTFFARSKLSILS